MIVPLSRVRENHMSYGEKFILRAVFIMDTVSTGSSPLSLTDVVSADLLLPGVGVKPGISFV